LKNIDKLNPNPKNSPNPTYTLKSINKTIKSNMKKIILTLLLSCFFTAIQAQKDSSISNNTYAKIEESKSSNNRSNKRPSLLSIQFPERSSDPIHSAGRNLNKAGTLLTIASISATTGSVLLLVGSRAGFVFTILAVVCEFSAYSQLRRAGYQLQNTEVKK
jgi:hypothetical protein